MLILFLIYFLRQKCKADVSVYENLEKINNFAYSYYLIYGGPDFLFIYTGVGTIT